MENNIELTVTNPGSHIILDDNKRHIDDYAPYVTLQKMTMDELEQKKDLVSKDGTFYVITDYYTDENGKKYPGIRIGDGNAYVADLPTVSQYSPLLMQHIQNKVIHIDQDERKNWNSKITCSLQGENLVFKV